MADVEITDGDASIAMARANLGDETFKQAWTDGIAMTRE
jgi:hypothetical protein